MILLLSPAKKQVAPKGAGPSSACTTQTPPRFSEEAKNLRRVLAAFGEEELGALFRLSEKKAAEVHSLYHGGAPEGPAVELFRGVAFTSLLGTPVASQACPVWQRHLRILSGLYGYLRPFDRIEGYRLDLDDRIPGMPTENLHRFWRDKVTGALLTEETLRVSGTILDLASKEYSDLLDWDRIRSAGVRRIAPHFFTESEGKRKRVSVHAKQGRGALARYVLDTLSEKGVPASAEEVGALLEGFSCLGLEYLGEREGEPTILRHG